MQAKILTGDAITKLKELPDQSIQTVITSPPYFGLRDYGVDGQIGMEATPEAYVNNLVEIFRHVWQKLRDDGTVWLNLGDSYVNAGADPTKVGGFTGKSAREYEKTGKNGGSKQGSFDKRVPGLKQKDLIGIPWRVAFALQQDGWYLRQDIIWHKPAPMPESVTDRCTKAHEYIFLLTKNQSYYYDAEAIRENKDAAPDVRKRTSTFAKQGKVGGHHNGAEELSIIGRNKRSVWSVNSAQFKEAHFAVFPPELIEPCVLAGAPEGGMVCDIFAGSGTTGEVALRANRNATLIEMNPEYVEIMKKRLEPLRSQGNLL